MAMSCDAVGQDAEADALVEQLGGQALKVPMKTRGLSTRGLTSVAPPKTETRSVTVTRGIPKKILVAKEDGNVNFKELSSGGAIEVNYSVDPDSKVTRDNILFRKGSDEFADSSSVSVVTKLAVALTNKKLKSFRYAVEGHASAEGSDYANQALSQRRAEKIVSVLMDYGVNSSRLVPVGFGESKANHPEYASEHLLKQDRRVVIFRLSGKY